MNNRHPASLIQNGRLFSDGWYTDPGRWVRAEEYERVKAELDAIKAAQYHCNICGGLVDLRGALRPTASIGPGNKVKHSPTSGEGA